MFVTLGPAAAAALLVSLLVGRIRHLPGAVAPTAGLVAGWAVLAASGWAWSLVTILAAAVAVVGLLAAAASRRRVPSPLRAAVIVVVVAGVLLLLYRRGDVHGAQALLVAAAASGFAVAGEAFARPRHRVGLPHGASLLVLLAPLAMAWFAAASTRIVNPGWGALSVVLLGATLPLVGRPADRSAGTFATAAVVFGGVYGWLAYASPEMVAAPLAVVAADVVWSLARRALGHRRTAWQRLADARGVGFANGVHLAVTVACIGLAAVEWFAHVRAVVGLVPFAVLLVAALVAARQLTRTPNTFAP